MRQWEYCYTVKGYVMVCTTGGDQTTRMQACLGAGEQGSVAEEACIVAHLGLEGWEAVGTDALARLWFKRPRQD